MPSRSFDLKDYVPVSERLEQFRAEHPLWGLHSEVVVDDGQRVLIRAWITDEGGLTLATGHAEEVRGEGQVNKTNTVENAETSAWGRALANLGYEVKRGIASQEDMARAGAPADQDWFQANGWADRAEHDSYRQGVVDLLARATPAEQAAFKARREAAGIPGFSQAHTNQQAAVVSDLIREVVKDPEQPLDPAQGEPAGPTPPKRAKPPDQRLAQRARELGLSAQERGDVVHAITAGRTRSGKDLSPEELLQAEESLVGLVERRLEFTYDAVGNPSLVEAQRLAETP